MCVPRYTNTILLLVIKMCDLLSLVFAEQVQVISVNHLMDLLTFVLGSVDVESLLRSIILQIIFVCGDIESKILKNIREENFKALVKRFHKLMEGY